MVYVTLLISYIFNLKAPITATFGYIIALFLDLFLKTDDIVFRDRGVHDLFAVWLFNYWALIDIGLIYEFIKKLEEISLQRLLNQKV